MILMTELRLQFLNIKYFMHVREPLQQLQPEILEFRSMSVTLAYTNTKEALMEILSKDLPENKSTD